MQRPRCSMKLPKIRRSTEPVRRARSMAMRAMRGSLGSPLRAVNASQVTLTPEPRFSYSPREPANPLHLANPAQEDVMADVESPGPSQLNRRRFLGAALGATAALPAIARQAGAQAKPTI